MWHAYVLNSDLKWRSGTRLGAQVRRGSTTSRRSQATRFIEVTAQASGTSSERPVEGEQLN